MISFSNSNDLLAVDWMLSSWDLMVAVSSVMFLSPASRTLYKAESERAVGYQPADQPNLDINQLLSMILQSLLNCISFVFDRSYLILDPVKVDVYSSSP